MSGFKLKALRPAVRRVLALDAGSRRVKLLLAESDFGRLRILKEELLDLQAEGLVSADEVRSHLRFSLERLDNPPVALALPQHLSISQVIELPLAPESEVDKLIADETVKLSGVSESRIVYDFVRTETAARNRQQFWVTLCQEGDIRERILRLGIEQDELCDITTVANALIAAFRATSPLSSRAILVHLGAQTTVVVILLAGQGAFASSFQMGGDFFTRALARQLDSADETAEQLKQQKNLLRGPDASSEFAAIVDGWVAELKRQLSEWFQQNPAVSPDTPAFELIASGGGFDQPGLLEYLQGKAELPFQPWPRPSQPESVAPAKGYEIAFGAALQALGYSAQPVSLLPEDYRLAWRKRLGRQRLEFASAILVLVCAVALAFGTWHKLGLIRAKESLAKKIAAAQDNVQASDSLTSDLQAEYESLRPLFAAQQNTADTLRALGLLQQSRGKRDLWFVLVADQQSYFTAPPALLFTNRVPRTNVLGPSLDLASLTPGLRPLPPLATNSPPVHAGLIAELCVPGEPETSRQTLSQLVNSLQRETMFAKVDQLSDDLRRTVADPKVVLSDRDFVLAMDFAQTDFLQPMHPLRKTGAERAPSRRTGRSNQTPEMMPPMTP
ncbi:MAG TPA: pilus assembly protein PilM [Verrucomicrobiae bacterium]|nr:pilus assembly protein PilM [Verrucomicrobiae bacterium]